MTQEFLWRHPTATGTSQSTFTWSGWTKYCHDTTARQTLFSFENGNGQLFLSDEVINISSFELRSDKDFLQIPQK